MTNHSGMVANSQSESDSAPTATAETGIAELRAEALGLAMELPGPLRRLTLRGGVHEVEIEWQTPDPKTVVQQSAGQPSPIPAPGPEAAAHASHAGHASAGHAVPAGGDGAAVDQVDVVAVDETDAVTVRSPLVGTFYWAPEPGAAPFVEVGETVEPGQTVGIVEAMKLMNPIVADTHGVVIEVCVANEDPVEFDQPLFRISSLDRPEEG